MIHGAQVLAVIPARGGSKGIPRKNLRLVGGKPLIAWTIATAKGSRYVDRLIVSSEDTQIIETARREGCEVPFVRPAELARDDTPGIEPVLHALEALPGYDYVVLLQPTSPLREVEDIDRCIERCVESGADAFVSVSQPDKSPYWMYTLAPGGRLKPLIQSAAPVDRRQDLPAVYALNGAVYVARSEALSRTRTFVGNDTVAYVMPTERALDIDSELDLTIAGLLLGSKRA